MSSYYVIGQQEALGRLQQLIDENRVPHAMLITGPAGAGKMAVAMMFARMLLTEGLDEDKKRYACTMLDNFEHPDLYFSYPTIKTKDMPPDYKPQSDDFATEWLQMMKEGPYPTLEEWLTLIDAKTKQSLITVGESNRLIHNLSFNSSQGGYKIDIMWLPERMNLECANKLLKLFEEPPKRTVFILVSEQPENLLETIRSRMQRFDIKKISNDDMQQALIERRQLSADDAMRIAHVANGNWNKALEMLSDDNENKEFLDAFIKLMRLSWMRNIHDLKAWSEDIAEWGRDKLKRMFVYFQHMIRESFMYNFRQPELIYMTREEENFCKNFARFINEANVIDIMKMFDKAYRDIGQNVNAKIVLFDIAINNIVLLLRK